MLNGTLVIEIEAAENPELLLTGFVLEPADGPSVLFSPEDSFTDDNEILFAEALIADAIGETLEEIAAAARSEEHTSELQSRRNLVCRLLLEKKKKKQTTALAHQYKYNSAILVNTS